MTLPADTDPYAYDRLTVPDFFVVTRDVDDLDSTSVAWCMTGAVVTQTGADRAYPCRVGPVCRDTPLGQGLSHGVNPETDLRPATPAEVLTALRTRHPWGRGYRPSAPTELMRMSDHLMWASAVRNWTNERGDGVGTTLTLAQVQQRYHELDKQYSSMLRRWWLITRRQRQAIKAALGA